MRVLGVPAEKLTTNPTHPKTRSLPRSGEGTKDVLREVFTGKLATFLYHCQPFGKCLPPLYSIVLVYEISNGDVQGYQKVRRFNVILSLRRF